jgi:hypothetical protein
VRLGRCGRVGRCYEYFPSVPVDVMGKRDLLVIRLPRWGSVAACDGWCRGWRWMTGARRWSRFGCSCGTEAGVVPTSSFGGYQARSFNSRDALARTETVPSTRVVCLHWSVTESGPEPAYRAEAKRADRRIKLIFGIVLWMALAALDAFIIIRDSSRPGPLPSSVWWSVALLVLFGVTLVRSQLRTRREN